MNHPFLPGIREQLKLREIHISNKSSNNNLEKNFETRSRVAKPLPGGKKSPPRCPLNFLKIKFV